MKLGYIQRKHIMYSWEYATDDAPETGTEGKAIAVLLNANSDSFKVKLFYFPKDAKKQYLTKIIIRDKNPTYNYARHFLLNKDSINKFLVKKLLK